MNAFYILMLMTLPVRAQEVPGFPRKTDSNQDLGYANQNFSDLASRSRDRATNTITPQFCPAGSTLTGAYYNKSGATVGGTCTALSTSGSTPQPSWQGINYWVGGSSGTRVAYSTGTEGVTTAVDSYHIADSSWVVSGTLCHTNDTTFTMTRSSISVVWLDTNCALQVSGSTTTSWVSISSYTPVIGDGIPIAISSTGALGDVHQYIIVNDQASQSYAAVYGTRGSGSNAITIAAGAAPDPWWPCLASHNIFTSCSTGVLSLIPQSVWRGTLSSQYVGSVAPDNVGGVFIVNNTGSGAQNILFSNYSSSAYQVSVDGGGLQNIAAATNSANISIGTGRHGVAITANGEAGISWKFPPNMKFVRPGPI